MRHRRPNWDDVPEVRRDGTAEEIAESKQWQLACIGYLVAESDARRNAREGAFRFFVTATITVTACILLAAICMWLTR